MICLGNKMNMHTIHMGCHWVPGKDSRILESYAIKAVFIPVGALYPST